MDVSLSHQRFSLSPSLPLPKINNKKKISLSKNQKNKQKHPKVRALTQIYQLVNKFLLPARYIRFIIADDEIPREIYQFSLEDTPLPFGHSGLITNSFAVLCRYLQRALQLWSSFPPRTLKRGPGGEIRIRSYFSTGLSGGLVSIYNLHQRFSKCGPWTNHNGITLGTCQTYKFSGPHPRAAELETLEFGPKNPCFKKPVR